MKTYRGVREGYAADVTVNGRPLNPRLDLVNHSPTGFEWGYRGSGPAQLALAILADHLRDDERVLRVHQDFKEAVIARLPHGSWTITGEEINQALRKIKASVSSEAGLSV